MSRMRVLAIIGTATVAVAAAAASQMDAVGAGALLFPRRQATRVATPQTCINRVFQGQDLRLDGWECPTTNDRKGTLIYLHGIGDNRGTATGIVQRFNALGFDVVAYDSRAHGNSEGDRCTYGYYEKQDLLRVIDQIQTDSVFVMGHSLGAAVALQAAPLDSRIRAVIAAATFSDLRTVATERAPFFFVQRTIDSAFARAERDGKFRVDEVSALRAASEITVPVLLIHGQSDINTPPEHSQRVFAALRAEKQLILVPSAGHNNVLHGDVWQQIEAWLLRAAHASAVSLTRAS